MSRAFVKEDSSAPEEPVKRQPSGRPNYVTPAGLAALRRRVEELAALRAELLAKKRPEEQRPLELQQAEYDLAYYEGQVKSARVVDNSAAGAADVRFGASVRVRDASGAEKEYSIVGEDEADAASGKLNWASPLAAALIGRKPGDRAVLERRGGNLEFTVVSVSYPSGA
jgi:transcription elongation GreA/GreB family factor